MGTKKGSRSVADALFSQVQQRVLRLVFGDPHRRFQSAELIRLAGSGTGAVHRQLGRLAEAGLVTVTRSGNQKHYQANVEAPVFEDLHGLVVKTVAVAEPLRRVLAKRSGEIDAAFVFGSVAKGREGPRSDLDLLVISDGLKYADLYDLLQGAERSIGRSINPILMTRADWRAKRARADSLVARIAAQPKIVVQGSLDDLA